MKEWEERLDRIEAIMAETAKHDEERAKHDEERAKHDEERAKRLKEYEEESVKRAEKNEAWLADYKADNKKAFDELRKNISGISDGNGMAAEEYFYNTLSESMAFGGNHFDFVESNRKRKCRDKDGKPVETEYDILMINKTAACIFEVKYRARKVHLDGLLEKVGKFRIQFPDYAGHKVFLGIGALSFDPGVENAAKERGIGIMKQNGDALEIYDKDLKVY